VDKRRVTSQDFETLAGLHELTPDLYPIAAASASCVSTIVWCNGLDALRFAHSRYCRLEQSRTRHLRRYAAVFQVDRRLQANLELAASLAPAKTAIVSLSMPSAAGCRRSCILRPTVTMSTNRPCAASLVHGVPQSQRDGSCRRVSVLSMFHDNLESSNARRFLRGANDAQIAWCGTSSFKSSFVKHFFQEMRGHLRHSPYAIFEHDAFLSTKCIPFAMVPPLRRGSASPPPGIYRTLPPTHPRRVQIRGTANGGDVHASLERNVSRRMIKAAGAHQANLRHHSRHAGNAWA